MRIGCSKLNYDHCSNLHLKNNMSCLCLLPIESAFHFFFTRPLLTIKRKKLTQTQPNMPDLLCDDLLSGIEQQTQTKFLVVQEFIVETKWFV